MPKKKKETSQTNTKAEVFDGDRLIRTYTEVDHGESFAVLAQQFADKNNFQVVYGE
jgi:hypothetical protein